jgi:hypothetical protein
MKPIFKELFPAICLVLALISTLFTGMELFGITFAILPVVMKGEITDALLANVRRWHGKIDEQFANINNLVVQIEAHKEWELDNETLNFLKRQRDALQVLNAKCNAGEASPKEHRERSAMLKTTVGFCLMQMKLWAYNLYNTGMMTITQLHDLHFLLPNETGGHHDRGGATKELPDIKVKVVNMDNIEVVLDQANVENAALVRSGWPKGVKQAVIVILASDGVTEVYHQMTTRLYNEIEMPAGSRGKMFIAKAAFLAHIDDEPKFSSQQTTFSMPQTTEDLAIILNNQHHDDFEANVREVEAHRRDVERLQSELDAMKRALEEEKKKKGEK